MSRPGLLPGGAASAEYCAEHPEAFGPLDGLEVEPASDPPEESALAGATVAVLAASVSGTTGPCSVVVTGLVVAVPVVAGLVVAGLVVGSLVLDGVEPASVVVVSASLFASSDCPADADR